MGGPTITELCRETSDGENSSRTSSTELRSGGDCNSRSSSNADERNAADGSDREIDRSDRDVINALTIGMQNTSIEAVRVDAIETHITLFVHPTSANAMYRAMGRRVVISVEGRAFKKLMAELLSRTPHGYITGPVKLTLAFEFKTNRKRDLDNYAKPLIDTLKGVLFVDDSDIYILNMTKRIGASVDCVRIDCVPIYEDTI